MTDDPPEENMVGWRWKRVVVAGLAAVVLLTGALNVRSAIGDGDRKAWEHDPAAPSAADQLVGAPARAASRLDGVILGLQDTLRTNRDNGRAATLLGQAYLQKTRETGDPSYYPKAEALFHQALTVDPNDYEAMGGLGALALARHDFAVALQWGERAVDFNPHHAASYGIVGDALIELGRYEEAIATFQQMVDLRPDLSSYARVSYARELMGDTAGAIEAMEKAAVAGASSAENVAWCEAQLGNLLFNSGDLAGAERRYQQALATLPGYVYGLAGLGRVAAAREEYDTAIARYGEAIQTMPVPEFVIALGDVYQAAGRPEDAARQYALVDAMQQLYRENGVNTDLEMALFDADHGRDLPGAVARARAQYAERPSIHAADVLAWTLYQIGDYRGARDMSLQALRLGTKDALMLFHAGMIEARLGHTGGAIAYLQAALDLNPRFSPLYADQALSTLTQLQGDAR